MEQNATVMEKLDGTVDRIIFSNQKKDYSVFRLKLDGQHGTAIVTLCGTMPLAGQQLILQGKWIEHAKYGTQFEAHTAEVVLPDTVEEIEKYLLNTAGKEVTPRAIKALIKHFGNKSLDVLELYPERITDARGVGKKTAAALIKIYRENAGQRNLMKWLEEHNVNGSYAGVIFQKFGHNSVSCIEKNPYCLVQELKEISFTVCDILANSLGIEMDNQERIISGLNYVLLKLSQDGHCCVPEAHLVSEAAKLLSVPTPTVHESIKKALAYGLLEQEYVGDILYVYNADLYEAEKYVAKNLLYLKNKARDFQIEKSDILIKLWEMQCNVHLAGLQKEAVEQALKQGIFVLTGGPGTGKTTVIRAMIDIMEDKGLEIILGAPTGRAAKRLKEATERKAYTIHRMLEANSTDDEEPFNRNEDNPLEADAIILDEVSMMDIMLMKSFLAAVPEGCHVIMVGDVDQLPSVGPGSVLKDILRSGQIPQICLTEIFRQQGTSNIVINAHAINKGRTPLENMKQKDFYFREINDSVLVENDIIHMVCDILPNKGYSDLDDIQILSPMHRGACGVERLNLRLQSALNPAQDSKKELKIGERIFREGDKVMQIRNNYDKKVFNGDIGYIEYITKTKLRVDFGEGLWVEYDKEELIDLQLAYCISVHKSQGSEYRVVVMPLVAGHYIMLQRNLIYTAITRAKDLVILEGSKAALFTAVENDRTRMRYSLLTERLCEAL